MFMITMSILYYMYICVRMYVSCTLYTYILHKYLSVCVRARASAFVCACIYNSLCFRVPRNEKGGKNNSIIEHVAFRWSGVFLLCEKIITRSSVIYIYTYMYIVLPPRGEGARTRCYSNLLVNQYHSLYI